MPTHSRRPLTAKLSLFAGSIPGPVGLYLPTVLGAQEVLSNCLKNGTGMVTRDVAGISPAHVGLVSQVRKEAGRTPSLVAAWQIPAGGWGLGCLRRLLQQ